MSDGGSSVDPAALEQLLDMTGGDPEFVDELVQTYLEDALAQIEAMRAAAETGSMEDLVRPAHSLKSNSANMGAHVLAEQCRQLEADARAGTVERATDRVAETAAEFERVKAELTRLRAAP